MTHNGLAIKGSDAARGSRNAVKAIEAIEAIEALKRTAPMLRSRSSLRFATTRRCRHSVERNDEHPRSAEADRDTTPNRSR